MVPIARYDGRDLEPTKRWEPGGSHRPRDPSGRRAPRVAAGGHGMEGGVEFRHLEALVAIVEEGSFTSAADVLNTVQSNVSEQIRQLEAELGVPLLVRSRRGAEIGRAHV